MPETAVRLTLRQKVRYWRASLTYRRKRAARRRRVQADLVAAVEALDPQARRFLLITLDDEQRHALRLAAGHERMGRWVMEEAHG